MVDGNTKASQKKLTAEIASSLNRLKCFNLKKDFILMLQKLQLITKVIFQTNTQHNKICIHIGFNVIKFQKWKMCVSSDRFLLRHKRKIFHSKPFTLIHNLLHEITLNVDVIPMQFLYVICLKEHKLGFNAYCIRIQKYSVSVIRFLNELYLSSITSGVMHVFTYVRIKKWKINFRKSFRPLSGGSDKRFKLLTDGRGRVKWKCAYHFQLRNVKLTFTMI